MYGTLYRLPTKILTSKSAAADFRVVSLPPARRIECQFVRVGLSIQAYYELFPTNEDVYIRDKIFVLILNKRIKWLFETVVGFFRSILLTAIQWRSRYYQYVFKYIFSKHLYLCVCNFVLSCYYRYHESERGNISLISRV